VSELVGDKSMSELVGGKGGVRTGEVRGLSELIGICMR
jgi:hypothetical protein